MYSCWEYLHLPAAQVSLWKNIGSVRVGFRKIQENIWKYCDQLNNSEVNVAKVKSNATWGKPDSSPQVNQVGGACDVYPPSSLSTPVLDAIRPANHTIMPVVRGSISCAGLMAWLPNYTRDVGVTN